MINLHTLRPIQIVDVSFQLMRQKFVSSLLIALLVSLPAQLIVWVFELSAGDTQAGLQSRTALVASILQAFSIGISLTLTSNVLSSRVGKIYSNQIFENKFNIQKSGSHLLIAIYHIGIQIAFTASLIGLRFLLGRFLVDSQANNATSLALAILIVPWAFATLVAAFAVPIATHEGGSFSQVLKRCRALNKIHFWKLFGVYCISIFLILVMITPALTALSFIISNNLIKSEVGEVTLQNIVKLIVIASVSLLYSFILTITYFNARIEHEGFDIAVAIQELEEKGESRGKLLNTLQG